MSLHPEPTPSPENYVTPLLPRGFWARRLPSPLFYLGMLASLRRAARAIKAGRPGRREEMLRQSYLILHALERVGGRARVENAAAFAGLPGPFVFVGNHMSSLETLTLPWIIGTRHPITFVVKAGLMKLPWLGTVLEEMEAIQVGRDNPRRDLEAVLREGTERLQRGISVVIFPQAHRTAEVGPDSFNTLGVKLARRAGVPLVSLAIRSDAWGMGRVIKDLGRIDPSREVLFSFDEPISPDLPSREAMTRVTGFICGRLNRPVDPEEL